MTYADTFNLRSKSVVKMNDVANAVDGLLVAYSQVNSTATVSLTSSTVTDYTGISITVTTNSNEIVKITATASVSCATANEIVDWWIGVDGTNTSRQYCCPQDATTNGASHCVALSYIHAPSSGSHTYKLRWANATSAIHTIYSVLARMDVLVFQNT